MKLNAQLSVSSLDQLLKQVNGYKEKVESLPANLTRNLTIKAEQYIAQNLEAITDPDGNIDAHADKEISGRLGRAFLAGSQAKYLEFGTGPAGEAAPHPLAADVGWEYNSQDRLGSKIYQTDDGRIGWVYFDQSSGQFRFSEGIAAQMTVYKAGQRVRREIVETAKELMK